MNKKGNVEMCPRRNTAPIWYAPGGKWTFRVKKYDTNRTWEDMVSGTFTCRLPLTVHLSGPQLLAVIGDQVVPSDEICGIVVGLRFNVRGCAEGCLLPHCLPFALRRTSSPCGTKPPRTKK